LTIAVSIHAPDKPCRRNCTSLVLIHPSPPRCAPSFMPRRADSGGPPAVRNFASLGGRSAEDHPALLGAELRPLTNAVRCAAEQLLTPGSRMPLLPWLQLINFSNKQSSLWQVGKHPTLPGRKARVRTVQCRSLRG
jgi:hypothetical protein